MLYVHTIRHNGLVLSAPNSAVGEFWLPGLAVDEAVASSWEEFRHAAVPGMVVSVAPAHGDASLGMDNLQVVTMRAPEAHQLCDVWKGEIHGLRIDRLSRTLIFGTIGAIEAVMDRNEYTDWINTLPHSDRIHDHATLAVGDIICGVFRSTNGPFGRVLLSFGGGLAVLKKDAERDVLDRTARFPTFAADKTDTGEAPHTVRLHTRPEALSPLLFVENDELSREMWQRFLERSGVDVRTCASFDEAEIAVAAPDPDYKMAIVDVHLTPGANDYLGLELAKKLLNAHPDCRIVLTSAEDNTVQNKNGRGDIKVYGYIERPVLFEEWAATIAVAAGAARATALRDFLHETRAQDQFQENTAEQEAIDPVSLGDALSMFCEEARGVIAHVFEVHPRSWRGRSVGGVGALKWEQYRGKLGRSVIKDAAMSNEPIVDNDAAGWRHSWTQQMAPYKSCWAKRLPVRGHFRYVLVAFHADPGFFTTEMELRARCCAETVTRLLHLEILDRRGIHDSEQSTAGLGFACLAHEIYSTLNGVDVAIRGMRDLLSDSEGPPTGEAIGRLRNTVSLLGRHVPDLVTNARILRGCAGGDKPVSVAFCLKKAVTGIREAGWELLERPQNIDVKLEPPDEDRDWTIRANASALVTVFFNVLLNAVQQIELHACVRPKGKVRVHLQHYDDADGLPWALIFFRDSGPGIHPDEWERVFQAGYTTKEHGTGLGLHLCRQLLGRVHDGPRKAEIQVLRSVLWAGTTMGIRLPLSPEDKKGD